MKIYLILGLALLTGAAAGTDTLPPHPRLLFDAQGIAQLKQRSQQEPWAAQWKAFRKTYDKTMDAPIELPPRGGNWFHWYVCPTHGARLTQGKQIGPWQWEHICPVDKEVLHGDPSRPDRDFDGVAINTPHSRYATAIRDAGVLFQVTREARYAQRGRALLLAYADRYLSYPLHTTRGEAKIGGGRIGPQTLDEAMWLIPVAQGADLIWDTLSAADRRVLADKLFLPAARDVILAHKMGVHNIQCWKNSAVGVVGFLLGDTMLINAAIEDPIRGYRTQMAKGVQPDGVWYEGAWGYHFFTLSAVWPLTEAARNCRIDLYGEPLKKMFEAPVNLAMPNLNLPAFNDSGEVNIRSSLFELAYARYHDGVYLAALAGSKRRDEMALWFGLPQLPAAQAAALPSRNAQASGYAILQRGQGEQATWLCLKYGPHGGGHGHPDKNNFILYARGRVLCPDPGTRPYGSPLHAGWDKVTLAHNTLVVDETNQVEATGQCLAFGSDHGCDFAMTDAGPIAKGVRFIRTALLLNENLVVFVDQITADKPHTFDLATHCSGQWQQTPAGDKCELPARNGYQHLKNATLCRTNATLAQTLSLTPAWREAIVLAGQEPTQIITATGVGKSTEDRIPVTIFRRVAAQTTFVWALALDGAALNLQTVPSLDPRLDPTVTVRISSAASSWQLAVNSAKATVRAAVITSVSATPPRPLAPVQPLKNK